MALNYQFNVEIPTITVYSGHKVLLVMDLFIIAVNMRDPCLSSTEKQRHNNVHVHLEISTSINVHPVISILYYLPPCDIHPLMSTSVII